MTVQPTTSVQVAALTDTGGARAENEDSVYAGGRGSVSGWDAVAAVADGMGGHAHGAAASGRAIEALCRVLAQPDVGDPERRMARAFVVAHEAVRGLAEGSPRPPGSTLTALAVRGGQAVLGHIGDSRLYRLRGGRLEQLSQDHTAVAAEVREGRMSAEQAAASPFRNQLVRGLGLGTATSPQLQTLSLAAGDRFLLCSDGLWEFVPQHEIETALQREPTDPASVCRRLIVLARHWGTTDNIGVACLACGDGFAPAAAAERPRNGWLPLAVAVTLFGFGIGIIGSALAMRKPADPAPATAATAFDPGPQPPPLPPEPEPQQAAAPAPEEEEATPRATASPAKPKTTRPPNTSGQRTSTGGARRRRTPQRRDTTSAPAAPAQPAPAPESAAPEEERNIFQPADMTSSTTGGAITAPTPPVSPAGMNQAPGGPVTGAPDESDTATNN